MPEVCVSEALLQETRPTDAARFIHRGVSVSQLSTRVASHELTMLSLEKRKREIAMTLIDRRKVT